VGCTTILVGRKASWDGSPLIARNEDSANGEWNPKKVVVVHPGDQPRTYTSVISRLTVELPGEPLRYTAVPNAIPDEGVWGEAGINAANVAMSATETLTTNERVLGADPLVERRPAQGAPEDPDFVPERPGGIGEEDFLTLVLPYIRSAREGVLRLGALLERHGTYEMNGVAFGDADEIWWLETVGGHHWIARRVPDDCYVTMPNQLGIDSFDLDDALGEGREHLASPDLREFIGDNFLDLSLDGRLNPRDAFGSHSDADHVYNTPRAWYMQRALNPASEDWDGPSPRHTPFSDDLPWARVPERRLTIEDVKDVLSSHYQGTPYDPYAREGADAGRPALRPIGINRHSELSILQIRPYRPEGSRAVQWVAFASNPFNTLVPLYTNVDEVPVYLAGTTGRVTTENFYWASRIVAALADAHFAETLPEIERYRERTLAAGHALLRTTDARLAREGAGADEADLRARLAAANQEITDAVRAQTDALLGSVLVTASNGMRNRFSRSDN
jgi:dipeptidase